MNCVVLGGEGFIGSHLVARLAQSGHRVTIFDRQQNPFLTTRPAAEFVRGDFTRRESLARILQGADILFHLIGTTVPQTSNEDMAFDLQTNVLGTLGLLEACVGSGVRKVVFLSSGGTVYGIPQQNPISETHPTNPICSYGLTKLAIEKYLELFLHLYGLDYTVLRCANAYGERQDPEGQQGVIAVFLGRVARNLPITVWGAGEVVRDYVYVHDVVRALECAAFSQTQQRLFNIGNGVGFSINQILKVIEEVTDQKLVVEYRPGRHFDVPVNVLDISLAHNVLDWQPQFDLKSGLACTWRWVQSWARCPK